jgi:phosphatidate cytidylyltransferase
VAIAAIVFGGAALAALLAIAAAIGAWEFYRIARATGATPLDDAGIALAGLVPLAVHAWFQGFHIPAFSLGAVAILGVLALSIWLRGVEGKPLSAASITVMGVLYTGGTLGFGYALRYHPYAFADAPVSGRAIPSGALLVVLPLFVTWASDIGAYFVGRAIGKHKLIPAVSPGKTIEGAVGGLVASVIVAWIVGEHWLRPDTQLGFKWAPWGLIAFGVIVSVAAQVGDLAESLLKREAGVKDSSRILPGHGGILDRLDSLFFVLPVSYLLLGWLLTWAPR